MKTDPISAATHYRQALQAILHATTMQEMRKIAARVLEVTFTRAEGGHMGVEGGYSGRPFVTIHIANPTESANPFVQMSSQEARQQALYILEAADASESDGFLLTWLGSGTGDLSEPQAAALLADFRAYRERLRGATEEESE